MIENYGGLGYKGSKNNGKTIYVELKPDSLMVRRLQNKEADDVFKKAADGTLEENFQVRTLEMGKDKGNEVAEQIFDDISNVQLIKAYSEVTKWNSHRMVLVFNNMQDDSPNINVQCPLISDHNSVNGYASNFIDKIPTIIDYNQIFLIFVFSIIISLLATIYPSRVASKMKIKDIFSNA